MIVVMTLTSFENDDGYDDEEKGLVMTMDEQEKSDDNG